MWERRSFLNPEGIFLILYLVEKEIHKSKLTTGGKAQTLKKTRETGQVHILKGSFLTSSQEFGGRKSRFHTSETVGQMFASLSSF
jgi:hypothetical protein